MLHILHNWDRTQNNLVGTLLLFVWFLPVWSLCVPFLLGFTDSYYVASFPAMVEVGVSEFAVLLVMSTFATSIAGVLVLRGRCEPVYGCVCPLELWHFSLRLPCPEAVQGPLPALGHPLPEVYSVCFHCVDHIPVYLGRPHQDTYQTDSGRIGVVVQ